MLVSHLCDTGRAKGLRLYLVDGRVNGYFSRHVSFTIEYDFHCSSSQDFFSHSSIVPPIPQWANFVRSFEWGTVSNALLKFNTAMSVWVPVSNE